MSNVRMGEISLSRHPEDELTVLGLGSCIGVALLDRSAGVAAVAHVVLPQSSGATDSPGKYADLAVPELVTRARALGAVRSRLEAVIAGGARMFEHKSEHEVGARNAQAARAALARAGIRLRKAHTGGERGRTLKVEVGAGRVTIRMSGVDPIVLLEGSASDRRHAVAAVDLRR